MVCSPGEIGNATRPSWAWIGTVAPSIVTDSSCAAGGSCTGWMPASEARICSVASNSLARAPLATASS